MELRPYQEEIAQKIDERFQGRGREARRFVGVKLPTGGGKSFLFLDQFDKLIDRHNQQDLAKNIFENPKACISEARVKYYAPLKGILEQTQTRVSEYILLDRYIDLWKQKEKITELGRTNLQMAFEEITNRMVASAGIKGKKQKQVMEEIGTITLENEQMPPEAILKRALEEVLVVLANDLDKIVKTEFPELDFVCYQKDDEKEEVIDEIFKLELELELKNRKKEPELCVFDEAHRNKVKDDGELDDEKTTWGERAKELIKNWSNTLFLAITATPERDADGMDPMQDFADIAGYSVKELREQDYLASDMSLVSALEDELVVKPEIIGFDCMLDTTQEYQEVRETLTKMMKNQKKVNILNLRIDRQTGKYQVTDEYHVLLVNFMKMCKLSGKFDFVKEHLQEESLITALDQFENDSYKTDDREYYQMIEKILIKIFEIDDEKTEIHKEYESWRSNKVASLVKETVGRRAYLQYGKFICFTPSSDSKAKTPVIMKEHQQMMEQYLGLTDEDVMLTHSNSKVVSKSDDKRNLTRFTMPKDETSPAQVMVAMDKFNEGLHVDGVVGSFMFRQFIDRSDKVQEDGKTDPRIIFLQQVGRCIHSISPGEVVTEPPVIFDLACNFMRYNEKLKNIFQISPNQTEFKQIYDSCREIGKAQTQSVKEEEIPKPRILDRIFGIMQALTENGIDMDGITNETTWEEIESKIPEEKREEVLNGIFVMTRKRMKPDYPIGARIASARATFWRTERENSQTKAIKKLYNKQTDEFFEEKTFEELYELGFFKDLEKNLDFSKVDPNGFIVGNCAGLDNYYGFNITTGTKYTRGFPEYGNPGIDVKGFSETGIHKDTGIRYAEYFFRFDQESGQWVNLFTGKDEDLLGFNHEGICVNPEKGRVGFDRNRLWHKKLEDGSYSKEGSSYDEEERDAFGFGKDNKTPNGTEYVNNFYRIKRKDGTFSYRFKDGTTSDYDGYDIDGYNQYGFNREGIHRDTGCKYDYTGLHYDDRNIQRSFQTFPLEEILAGTYLREEVSDTSQRNASIQEMLTQWIVLSKVKESWIQKPKISEWYYVLQKKLGIDISKEVAKMSEEFRISQQILAQEHIQMIHGQNKELDQQEDEKKRLIQAKSTKKAEISKLVEILNQIAGRKDVGGPEL